jgi:hypothetical protein
MHGPIDVKSACLFLIFCRFLVNAPRIEVGPLYPLKNSWLRAWAGHVARMGEGRGERCMQDFAGF